MVAEFLNNIVVVGSLENVVEHDNIWVVEFLEDFDFVEERLLEVFVSGQFLFGQNLHGDFLLSFEVLTSVYFSESAFSENSFLVKGILANILDLGRVVEEIHY